MENESNREIDRPSGEAERPAEDDDRRQAAEGAETRSEPADVALGAATEGQNGERLRLPSIDDYDWEQQIERIARRLSPHRSSADEAEDDGVEEEPLRPAADAPASLRRAADAPASLRRAADAPARLRVGRYGAAAEVPHWQEPVSRRPVARVLAVTVPVLAVAAVWPFVQGAWTAGLDRLPGGDKPVTGVIFQPSPHAPAVSPLSLGDAPRAASRQASRAAAMAFALTPLHRQNPLRSAGEVEGLALAAARERQALAAEQPRVTQARVVAAPPDPARATAAAAKPPIGSPPAADGRPVAEPDTAVSAAPKGDLAAPVRSPEVTGKDAAAAQQPGLRRLSEREIEDLLRRGHQLLEIGDIASARLLFQLVAEAGDPRGAKAMGMTFDPSVFAELPVAGMAHDRAQAEVWYDRSDAMPALAPAEEADAEGAVRAADNRDRRGAR